MTGNSLIEGCLDQLTNLNSFLKCLNQQIKLGWQKRHGYTFLSIDVYTIIFQMKDRNTFVKLVCYVHAMLCKK